MNNVNFEIATLAERVGFRLPSNPMSFTTRFYHRRTGSIIYWGRHGKIHRKNLIYIPNIYELQEWLFKEHKIHIEVCLSEDTPYNEFYYRVTTVGKYFVLSYADKLYKTPEETLTKGVETVLNDLLSND